MQDKSNNQIDFAPKMLTAEEFAAQMGGNDSNEDDGGVSDRTGSGADGLRFRKKLQRRW